MYNGIGLQTARGSGTNGYVQKNLSFVKQMKNKIEYKSEEDFQRLEREFNRVPNKEILEHQNKRQIELKCLQMEDRMEKQGFTEEEIELKVKEFREQLMSEMESSVRNKRNPFLDDSELNLKETHKMAEMNAQKNNNIKHALRIDPYFTEGTSLDPTRKAREALEKEKFTKKYALVKEPSPEPQKKEIKNDIKREEKHKKSHKERSHKKQNSRKHRSSDSESDSSSSSSDDSSRKRKKNKSKEKRSKDKKRDKRKDNQKSRKHQKYSDSSHSSDSDSETGSSSGSDSSDSDSSNSSDNRSRNHRKSDSLKRKHRKSSTSPDMGRKRAKTDSDLKDLNYGNDLKTNPDIAIGLKQIRKEIENVVPNDRQRLPPNDEQNKDNKKESIEVSPRRRQNSRSRSRSSSASTEPESNVKRLKSTVYEMSSAKRSQDIPKSYSNNNQQKRSESGTNRSVSPEHKSRHSSRSMRSRSQSNDSKSSDRSSQSSGSSKSSSKSSDSGSRSRSPSIPRRKGSPSFLDKRRITSARKRPIPYRRTSSRTSCQSSSGSSESRSRCSSRSKSISSSDSFNSNAYQLI